MTAHNEGDFLVNARARVGHNSQAVTLASPDSEARFPGLLARGFAKYREALKDLPAEYRPPESYATLEEWLAANPSPRQWARRKARELLAESAAFRELGMDLREATHWLAEHAHKWKRMVEARAAQT